MTRAIADHATPTSVLATGRVGGGPTPIDPFAALTDAGTHDDVRRLIQGDTLDYGAMETILQDAAWGGIQTSGYLCAISRALIDGDPANAHWTGGRAMSSDLGNLTFHSSEAQADRLIDTWFHGVDEPSLAGIHKAG